MIRAVLALPVALLLSGVVAAQSSVKGPPPALRVSGKTLVDVRSNPVRLRGVNVASLEWTSDGEGHVLESVRVAVDDWIVNHIRLPLSQDRWFGKAPEQSDEGKSYRSIVNQVIEYCSSQGVYVMPDRQDEACLAAAAADHQRVRIGNASARTLRTANRPTE